MDSPIFKCPRPRGAVENFFYNVFAGLGFGLAAGVAYPIGAYVWTAYPALLHRLFG
jgi:hypothetical protein